MGETVTDPALLARLNAQAEPAAAAAAKPTAPEVVTDSALLPG